MCVCGWDGGPSGACVCGWDGGPSGVCECGWERELPVRGRLAESWDGGPSGACEYGRERELPVRGRLAESECFERASPSAQTAAAGWMPRSPVGTRCEATTRIVINLI